MVSKQLHCIDVCVKHPWLLVKVVFLLNVFSFRTSENVSFVWVVHTMPFAQNKSGDREVTSGCGNDESRAFGGGGG